MLGGSLPSWKTFLLLLWKLRGGNCVVRGQWLLGRHSLVWFCVRPCFWALPKHHFSRMDFQNSGLSNSSFWVILQSIAFEVAVCYPLYFVLWSLLRVVCFETENLWVALPALELILLDSQLTDIGLGLSLPLRAGTKGVGHQLLASCLFCFVLKTGFLYIILDDLELAL